MLAGSRHHLNVIRYVELEEIQSVAERSEEPEFLASIFQLEEKK